MITPLPDENETENEEAQNLETQRYLAHLEQRLYADIEARKRIDAGLLFLACQISACSLSWLLFHLQTTLIIIQVASACLALLPGLIDLGDSFTFSLSSEAWEFNLGRKPLVGVAKLAIGGAVSFSGTSRITAEFIQTQNAIAQTYQEIRSSEGLSFQLPNIGLSILIGLSAVALITFFQKFSTPKGRE